MSAVPPSKPSRALSWCLSMPLLLTRCPVADIISTVEFDHTGNYLATGDKGGRVVLFERNETVCTKEGPVSDTGIYDARLTCLASEKNL